MPSVVPARMTPSRAMMLVTLWLVKPRAVSRQVLPARPYAWMPWEVARRSKVFANCFFLAMLSNEIQQRLDANPLRGFIAW